MPLAVEIPTAAIALYGAGLASYSAFQASKRKLIVSASFDARKIGRLDLQEVFVVSITNAGQRPVTVTSVRFIASNGSDWAEMRYTTTAANGQVPPFKLEPDSLGEVFFDSEHAANQLAAGTHAIRVVGAAGQGSWETVIRPGVIDEANEILERMAEQGDL